MLSSTNGIGTVGLIGVGTMGKCMLKCLTAEGFRVVAYDIFPLPLEYAKNQGADVAENPMKVAEKARLIIMSLPADKQVFDVIEGEGGLLGALTPEHVIVNTSTVSPETSREGARKVMIKRSRYIDAPILGRPNATGNWLLPAGGSQEAIEFATPALGTFAEKIVRVGNVGTGNALKLLNQLMFSVINAVSAEVMALTEVVGIDKRTFYKIVANSNAATVSGLFKETARRIISDEYEDPTFTIELLCKDVALGMQMLKNSGVTPLVAGFVQILTENAKGKGLAEKDTSIITKVFKEYYSKTN